MGQQEHLIGVKGMKIKIEQIRNGYIVTYNEEDVKYVFKATEDLNMIEDIAKRFLKRDVKVPGS